MMTALVHFPGRADTRRSFGRLGLLLVSAVWLALPGPRGSATVICQEVIEQPVNLAGDSDPGAIPLGLAAWEANHGYGIHELITAPRPCLHGAMVWRQGTELDQNLAHVFGISLEIEDGTQATASPVVIRVRRQPPPAYSPYSREQVVAATLHCLLRAVRATPEHPLDLRLATEDPRDRQWAARYERKYINTGDDGDPPVTPTPVPDTRLETDVYGVTQVVFTHRKRKPSPTATPPVLIPFRPAGENDCTETILFPVWVGKTGTHRLHALGESYGLFHDLWRAQDAHEVNALADSRQGVEWDITETDSKTEVSLAFHDLPDEVLAGALYAAIFSLQPTEAKPLVITLQPGADGPAVAARFANRPGWTGLTCEFVLDPAGRRLLRGSVPGLTVVATGPWPIRLSPPPPCGEAIPGAEDELYANLFQRQLMGEQAEPTLAQFHQFSPEGKQEGLTWEFWHAGYREAFLAYREFDKLRKPPTEPPMNSFDHLAQTRHAGWVAGNQAGYKAAKALWDAHQTEAATPTKATAEPSQDQDPKPAPAEPASEPLPDR